MKKELITDVCIFFVLLMLFSLVNIIIPVMPDFDWYNYRAYNSWAFLNDRMGIDFFVSNLRTCFNPLINLPEYFLMLKVKNFYLSTILGNVDMAILMLFVYKIIDFIFGTKSKKTRIWVFAFCVAYILFSPMILIFAPIGSHGDVKIALICIIGFYCFIRNVFNEHSNKRSLLLVLCGCLFGAATGLKYTAFVYFLTITLMFIILYKKIPRPIYSLFLFLSGGAFSFFLTGGIWMIHCYKYYHNPLFPYFNNIFKSEYASLLSVHSADYEHMLPKNFFEYIFYVFMKDRGSNNIFGYEQGIFEGRWMFSYIFIVIIFVACFIEKVVRKIKESFFIGLIDYKYLYSLLMFITFSYLINTSVFGTFRYIFADYCLFGAVFYIFAEFLKKNAEKIFVPMFCIIMTIFVYTVNMTGEMKTVNNLEPARSFEKTQKVSVYKNKDLNFKDNSTVLVLNDLASIGIVGQNKNVRYIGFALPNRMYGILDKLKYQYAIGGFFIYSNYISNLNRELVLGDGFLQILYHEDPNNLDFVMDILESYNAEREVPRKLSNCSNAQVVFYGVREKHYKIYRCDYN